MYVTVKQADTIVTNVINGLTEAAQEKSNFLSKLLQDDDWTFIIKSHSLIESLVNELVIAKMGDDLSVLIERLPLHGDVGSKMNFVKIYDLIPSDQRNFLVKISSIRNMVVHKFENINFTFSNYVAKLDSHQNKNFRKALLWESIPELIKNDIKKYMDINIKAAIYLSLSSFVISSLNEINKLKGEKLVDEASRKTSDEFMKNKVESDTKINDDSI